MKASADEMDRVKFLQEAAIMAQFKHPNVITLYGVVNTRGTVSGKFKMIVLKLWQGLIFTIIEHDCCGATTKGRFEKVPRKLEARVSSQN